MLLTLWKKVLEKNCNNPRMRQDILNLSKDCLNQNYCEFDGKIYMGKEGLAMGNPLSPLASEIFMDYLETKIRAHPYFKLFMRCV